MRNEDSITGIDIGSTTVRTVVGKRLDNGEIQIIGVGEAPSRGVSRGNITDLEETVTSLSESLERAERMIGMPLSKVVISVNGSNCKFVESQGVVAVSKPNGEVAQTDIERADEQSQAVATSPNYEILHVIPRYYNLDNQEHIKDPIGMTGIKLEAHTQVILALSSHVKLLNKALYRTQLELEGQVYAPLATAEVALSKRQRELGVAMVNLGAWTTSIAVFEEGELIHAAVLPTGADHITGDLAIGARVDVDVAERIKIDQGLVASATLSKRDEIDIAKFSKEDMPRHLFSRKMIAEIIEARLSELFEMIQKELVQIGKAGKLPAGIVLTGGGSKLKGIDAFAKEALELPVFLGTLHNVVTPIDKVKDPEFSTALGLIYFARHEEEEHGLSSGLDWAKSIWKGMSRKLTNFRRK